MEVEVVVYAKASTVVVPTDSSEAGTAAEDKAIEAVVEAGTEVVAALAADDDCTEGNGKACAAA